MYTDKDGKALVGKALVGKLVSHIVFGFIGLIILFGSWAIVGAGERGVRVRLGAVIDKSILPGFTFKIPLIESIVKLNVQIKKESANLDAASKDLQTVTSVVALNYHLDPSKVSITYRDIGLDYNARIIDPALQESLKASTAQFTAEDLIQKREEARQIVKDLLSKKLLAHGIIVDEFNVVNFKFSSTFEQAIEAKVTTEQNALAAKNKLSQIQYEAQQRVAQADGEAKAIAIQAQAIQQSGGKEYVNLKWVEKWNGQLPQTMLGSNTPLVNIGK